MKEELIKNYFRKFDFTSNWSYRSIREDLRTIIGEMPGIEVEWKKDVKLDEVMGTAKEVDEIQSIQIVFIDETNNSKMYKFSPSVK